ncbi:MAG: hypothetical protein IV100_33720, partial [Myxococcales bacterium]|nr:hypothetical protein [Myxococcales bacterium]
MAETLRRKYTLNRPDGPQCNICLRRFADSYSLRQHKDRIHNANRVDRFECETCHRRFGDKSNMLKHVRTVHLKERRFFCGDCGQAFGQSSSRDRHVRMMHDNIRSAPCFHCGKTFANDSALMAHTQRVHYGRIANPRPCTECDHVAESPSKLRAHFIARHTKLRFRCAFGCEIWYSNISNLANGHLKKKKIHRINRRYKYYA